MHAHAHIMDGPALASCFAMAERSAIWPRLAALFAMCAFLLPLSAGQDLARMHSMQKRLAELGALRQSDAAAGNMFSERMKLAMETFAHYWADLPTASTVDEAKDAAEWDRRLVRETVKKVGVSPQCGAALEKLRSVNGSGVYKVPVLYEMIDAFGKPPSGVLQGNTYAMGDFDQCLSNRPYTQYCFGNVTIRDSQVPIKLSLSTGLCLPSNCTIDDVEAELTQLNQLIAQYGVEVLLGGKNVTVCQADPATPYSWGTYVMLVVCCLFGFLALLGSVFDFVLQFRARLAMPHRRYKGTKINSRGFVQDNNKQLQDSSDSLERAPILGKSCDQQDQQLPKVYDFVLAFSLFKVLRTIMSTEQPAAAITSVHGIRVLSMFWVILCHTHIWVFLDSGVSNPLHVIDNVAPRFSFQAILNGFFSVDSFFFLSGLLTAYLTLRQLSRCRGTLSYVKVLVMYYVHRILRLTPAYAFVLFFTWTVIPIMGNGPKWPQVAGPDSYLVTTCEKYWWTNLLYINNLYPWKLEAGCISWTWYLGNDMQFYVIGPLMIIPLYFLFPLGLAVVGILLMMSFAITGALAGHFKYPASVFFPLADSTLPNQGPPWDYTDLLYSKPWSRVQPYLVGIVLGYFLYRKARIPFNRWVNLMVYIPLWGWAIFFGVITVYSTYPAYHGHMFTPAANVMYITFSRFAYGVALALLVFICHNGYGWIVNSFLSMKLWVPLGRLCFNAYLVHPLVLTVLFGTRRQPVYYTDYSLALYAVGVIVLSFGAAAVVTVFVEFPLSNVELALFKMVGLARRESTRQVEEPTKKEDQPSEKT